MKITIPDEESMLKFGANLSKACTPGTIIYLVGELGAGKTTLARGFLREAGHTGAIRSPTYTLVEHYELPEKDIFHIDLYRLSHPEEIEYLGLTDLITDTSIGLIEWPERGEGMLPEADIICSIDLTGDNQRVIQLDAKTERGTNIIPV